MPTTFANSPARADAAAHAQADYTLHTPTRPLLVSFAQSCGMLGMPLQTGRNLVCAGKYPVPTVKIGSRRLVPLDEIEAYVRRLTDEVRAENEAAKQHAGTPAKRRGHPGKAALLARRTAGQGCAQ